MKKFYLILLICITILIFSQEKAITMQRVESLSWVEPYPVGKIVEINELGDIFAVDNSDKAYYLKDGSNSWVQILDQYYNLNITGFYSAPDNSIFVMTKTGLYHSTNSSSYSMSKILVETEIFSTAVNSLGTIYSGTTDGLYRSDDNGVSWAISYTYPLKMAIDNNDVIYIEEYNSGLCRSYDNGDTWEEINSNLSKDMEINDIEIATDGTVFVSVKDNGLYKLSGDIWVIDTPNATIMHAGKDGFMYCSSYDTIYKKATTDNFWTPVKDSMGNITSFSSNSGKIIAAYADDMLIFESIDSGNTWTTNGQIIYPTILSLLTFNNYVFVGTGDGFYRSVDNGLTWDDKVSIGTIHSIAMDDHNWIYIGNDDGLFRSTDKGVSFLKMTGCPIYQVYKTCIQDSIFYAGGYGGFYKSTDYGYHWSEIPTANEHDRIDDIVRLNSGRVYVTDTHGYGLYYTDDDSTWIESTDGYKPIEANSTEDIFGNVGGNVSWLQSGQTTWEYLFQGPIYDIFIGADNVTFIGGVSKISYSGSGFQGTWASILGFPSSTSVNAVSKDNSGYIYGGMAGAQGLYKSNIPFVLIK